MSSGGIRVDSRELEAALDGLASEVAAMPATWAAVGDALLPGVRQRTPVASGKLEASWQSSGEADRASISSELPYAVVVEYHDRPIADTLAASERVIVDTLEEEVAREARRLGFEVRR